MNAYIKSIAYYLPSGALTNEDLIAEFPEWSVEKIAKKIGVVKRHISAGNETAGDMAVKAAEKLFSDLSIDRSTIDYILLCTQSPDYFLPTTACLIQERLGLQKSVGALDFNQGCSGYVYGLSLAKGLICAGIARNVLLLTSETYSKYIHPLDKSNRSIFGDAATASLISTEGFAEIGKFVLGTDGVGANNLIVHSGGARNRNTRPSSSKEEQISPEYLYMNGAEVFNFTLKAVPPLLEAVLEKNSVGKERVEKYILHQANKFMLETIRKICGIPLEKFIIDMEYTGNTVSSTIPITLAKLGTGIISRDGVIVLAGFGVGYSWGGCVLK